MVVGDFLATLREPVSRRSAAGSVDIHQSGVSRHLRILQEAGFVKVRPDGPKRLYSLQPEPFRELDTWVARYRSLWEARLDKFGEELERRQKARAAKREEGSP